MFRGGKKRVNMYICIVYIASTSISFALCTNVDTVYIPYTRTEYIFSSCFVRSFPGG